MSIFINWRIAIVKHRSLTSGAKGIALYLNTFMNDRHDFAFPSIATISQEMNMARATAIKYLSELESSGLLLKKKRFGASIIYQAKIPISLNSELVQELNSSSSNSELSVVQDLNSNSQLNSPLNSNKRAKRFLPPTTDQVAAYCKERGNKIDPEAFVDHYTATGWMRGKSKIKDWKACIRTWEKQNEKSGRNSGKSSREQSFLETCKAHATSNLD